jgi:hypothetical protein
VTTVPDLHIPFRTVARLAWSLGVLCLVAPWIAVAIVAAAARIVRAGVQAFRAARAALADSARCPRGHRSDLHGVFECRCGALFAGWAFEKCPVCNESCGYVSCEHCGLAVRNPVLVAIESSR